MAGETLRKILRIRRQIMELEHEYNGLQKDISVGLQFFPKEIAEGIAKRYIEVSEQLSRLYYELEKLESSIEYSYGAF